MVCQPGSQRSALRLRMDELEHRRSADVNQGRSSRIASRSAAEFLGAPDGIGIDSSADVPPGTAGGSTTPDAIRSASCADYACGGVMIPTTRPRLVTMTVSPLLVRSNTSEVLRVTSRTPIVRVVMSKCYNTERCSGSPLGLTDPWRTYRSGRSGSVHHGRANRYGRREMTRNGLGRVTVFR